MQACVGWEFDSSVDNFTRHVTELQLEIRICGVRMPSPMLAGMSQPST